MSEHSHAQKHVLFLGATGYIGGVCVLISSPRQKKRLRNPLNRLGSRLSSPSIPQVGGYSSSP